MSPKKDDWLHDERAVTGKRRTSLFYISDLSSAESVGGRDHKRLIQIAPHTPVLPSDFCATFSSA